MTLIKVYNKGKSISYKLFVRSLRLISISVSKIISNEIVFRILFYLLDDPWRKKRQCSRRLFIEDDRYKEISEYIRHNYKDNFQYTLEKAEDILNNKISLFSVKYDYGEKVQWKINCFNGKIWKSSFYSKIDIISTCKDDDIKYVWELNRLYQLVTLGKAFIHTADEKYSKKCIEIIYDWQRDNRFNYGPNWTCSMEVAIRISNLILATTMIRKSCYYTEKVENTIKYIAVQHLFYILLNLEKYYSVIDGKLENMSNNHYVANLLGLLYIIVYFPELHFSSKLIKFIYRELKDCINCQVDDDGVLQEYSPNYQGYVTEMFILGFILLKNKGFRFEEELIKKIIEMCTFIADYTREDGTIPDFRDVDNSRFHRLEDVYRTDQIAVLQIASVALRSPKLAKKRFREEVLWLFGKQKEECVNETKRYIEKRKEIKLKIYEKSGFAFLKSKEIFLSVFCCPIGMKGYCGHAHNDLLSFELVLNKRLILSDSGSYVYTRDFALRNTFRSVKSHNTVQFNDIEQNQLDPENVFRIIEGCKQKRLRGEKTEKYYSIIGEYEIKRKNGCDIKHKRVFYIGRDLSILLIGDILKGKGKYNIKSYFHIDSGVKSRRVAENKIIINIGDKRKVHIEEISRSSPKIYMVESGQSKIYGNMVKRHCVIFRVNGDLPIIMKYRIITDNLFDDDIKEKYESHIKRFDKILKKENRNM